MVVSIEYARGKVCCHSDIRQCTDCFKREIREHREMEPGDFDRWWRGRIARGPDDVVESITSYELVGLDARAAEEQRPTVMR